MQSDHELSYDAISHTVLIKYLHTLTYKINRDQRSVLCKALEFITLKTLGSQTVSQHKKIVNVLKEGVITLVTSLNYGGGPLYQPPPLVPTIPKWD